MGVVTTLAGTAGVLGGADGTGAAAQFVDPEGVAVDGSGNLYVADTGNDTIRKITPSGVVTTLAGTAGEIGSADGEGSAAQFYLPWGLSVDGNDNVFVADTGNNTIRMITPGGVVTTVAGAPDDEGLVGAYSFEADGIGASAHFGGLRGVAVDGSGTLYVADTGLLDIRKITSGAVVTTLAGSYSLSAGYADGTGDSARFNDPLGVAVDGSGNIYVADSKNETIRKIEPGGVVTDLAGSPNNPIPTAANGGPGEAPGTPNDVDGTGAAATFSFPSCVAVDGSGSVYVAGITDIRKITPGGVVTTLAGSPDGSPNAGGSADGTGSAAQFLGPQGIAADENGNVFVSDTQNYTIRRITPLGVVTTLAGTAGRNGYADGLGPAAQFSRPLGLAVDENDNVYVADQTNNVIRKITPAGLVSTFAGTFGLLSGAGHVDGPGSTAKFMAPTGVTVDKNGNVYVADSDNFAIREITPSGYVTTLAGGSQGSADGRGSSAQFNVPYGVAIDRNGLLYVADDNNNTIRIGVVEPTIVSQPQSQTLNSGSTVVFTVVATGASTYQWQFNGVSLSDGVNGPSSIAGSEGPQLVLTGTSAADAGSYTCIVTNTPVAGVSASSTTNPATLTVVSDQNPGAVTSISARAYVGTDDNILIGGFYIVGNTSVTVLIQAIGPALAANPFNVTGTLQHPTLTIHQTQNRQDVVLYSNTGWGSSPALSAAAAAVYAQPELKPDSADSELLVTLPPGGYTAEVSGAGGGTGVALCAVYQIP